MADRFIKYLPSGIVYIFDATWLSNPDFVEVADANGTPMHDTSQNPDYVPPKKKTKTKLDISDDEAALQADATRKLLK